MALLAAVVSPMSTAQMRGRPGTATGGLHSRHLRGSGFAYPFFYADYGTESLVAAPAPPVAVVERKPSQPEPPAQPLLIEWHGDRFVRYGGTQTGAQSPDYAEASSASPAVKVGTRSETSRELPPAVLVYRDGHREAVGDYVITGGILYARGDYSRDSSWMRNIHLSALDLPATFRANQDSGVKFVLPAAPNEVVTRP